MAEAMSPCLNALFFLVICRQPLVEWWRWDIGAHVPPPAKPLQLISVIYVKLRIGVINPAKDD